MFRGEPLAIHMILTGLLFFPITILLGLSLSNVIYIPNHNGLLPAHFVSAFMGWIGLVILGAQLQFFRAISGLRRFNPENLRPLYFISSTLGVICLLFGYLVSTKWMIYFGMFMFSICIIIHSLYILPIVNSNLFKFPLNYFVYAHIFLVVSVILMWNRIIGSPFTLANNFNIIHILSIGWISLNIQGAATRALPMFVGKVIDRSLRSWINIHAIASFVSSVILTLGLYVGDIFIISVGSITWFGSWIFTFILLGKSIYGGEKKLEYPITLKFFVPGFLFLTIGSLLGMYITFFGIDLPRTVHIHLNLVGGLGLIMLGAIHRISSFQMYTAVYTGRREADVRIQDFLRPEKFEIIPPGIIISILLLIIGLIFENLYVITIGGILIFCFVLYYLGLIYQNYSHYRREVPNAIPYDKKKSEV